MSPWELCFVTDLPGREDDDGPYEVEVRAEFEPGVRLPYVEATRDGEFVHMSPAERLRLEEMALRLYLEEVGGGDYDD